MKEQLVTLGILQARMNSSRLPGKVLMPLQGLPSIVRQFERLNKSAMVEKWVVATSTEETDNILEKVCIEHSIEVFRGSLNDVLGRFYATKKKYAPLHIIRTTGDCPLADPTVVDAVIKKHFDEGSDYTSNTLIRSFPKGLDCEVFSAKSFDHVNTEAKTAQNREHVTSFYYEHPEKFRLTNFKRSPSLAHLRWTLDYPEDYLFISKIYDRLYPKNQNFTTNEIVDLLNLEKDLLKLIQHLPS